MRVRAAILAIAMLAFAAPVPAAAQDYVFVVYGQKLGPALMAFFNSAHLTGSIDATVSDRRAEVRVTGRDPMAVIDSLCAQMQLTKYVLADGAIFITSPTSASASAFAVQSVHSLRYADAATIAASLRQAVPRGTFVPDLKTNRVIILADADTTSVAEKLIDKLDTPPALVTDSLPVPLGMTPKDAAAAVESSIAQLGYSVRVSSSDTSGSIVVTGSNAGVEAARTLMGKLTTPVRQVRLHIRVVELVPVNDSKDLGLSVGGYDATGNPQANGLFTSFLKPSVAVNASLHTLIARGAASVLASPDLLLVNNREGQVVVGDQFPVTYNVSGGLLGTNTLQTINSGVILRATAQIGPEGAVLVKAHIEFSQITGTNSFGLPTLSTRFQEQYVVLTPDTTAELGGLYETTVRRTEQVVPILGDIPLFGRLFRQTQSTNLTDEVRFYISADVDPGSRPGGLDPMHVTPAEDSRARTGGLPAVPPRKASDPALQVLPH